MATISSSNLTQPPAGTVTVSIIDSTSSISIPLSAFVKPVFKGLTHSVLPSYSFLITHPSGRKLLYDIGVRKNWHELSPSLVKRLSDAGIETTVQKDVRTILDENGFDYTSLEALIWSHGHFDHTGDPSRFPGVPLLVGRGFKEHEGFMPGYPAQDSPFLESDFAGREVRELGFSGKVGSFDAHDYFGDGSFYLLDAPGHFQGQMCGLARVGSGDHEAYIFMGADTAHHGGEFRPSVHMPLPKAVPESLKGVFEKDGLNMDDFAALLPESDRGKTFFTPSSGQDVAVAEKTIGKMQELDALDNVLVVLAHDGTLSGVLDFYPSAVKAEKVKAWKGATWTFLKDLVEAARGKKKGEDVVVKGEER